VKTGGGGVVVRVSSLIVGAVVSLALVSSEAFAGPIGVNVFSQTYSTTVQKSLIQSGLPPVSDSRSTSSSSPIVDHMMNSTYGYAHANASAFSVLADADATGSRGTFPSTGATATSILDFVPLADEIGSMALNVAHRGSPAYTEVVVQLLNLTTNQLLWDIGWSFGNSAEWINYRLQFPDGAPTLSTAFSHTNLYRLTMSTRVGASGDSQRVSLQLSGIQSVPEPASLSLLALGAVAVTAARARARRRRTSAMSQAASRD
jgi:hypothetical protein